MLQFFASLLWTYGTCRILDTDESGKVQKIRHNLEGVFLHFTQKMEKIGTN